MVVLGLLGLRLRIWVEGSKGDNITNHVGLDPESGLAKLQNFHRCLPERA